MRNVFHHSKVNQLAISFIETASFISQFYHGQAVINSDFIANFVVWNQTTRT